MDSRFFIHAKEALKYARQIYDTNINQIRQAFEYFTEGGEIADNIHGYYPYVKIHLKSAKIQSKHKGHLAYGLLSSPGIYETTLTAFDVLGDYYEEQLSLILKNHKIPIEIGMSEEKIPLNFAIDKDETITRLSIEKQNLLSEVFDLPDLSEIDDDIVNGVYLTQENDIKPLALFKAGRIDLSLKRLEHYTGTNPKDFQKFVMFTNYPFYVDEFLEYGKKQVESRKSKYKNLVISSELETLSQMPAYHLQADKNEGITLINIGVGPSNAKTITDHLAVLRPDVWIMLGHCAGLRNSQKLGDYVMAHGYLRMDGVLDEAVPLSVPIPPLSEIQLAIEKAIMNITKRTPETLKDILRTGTVITTADRDWELDKNLFSVKALSVSRAIALEMESATLATNGYRFRVPYGTFLNVSDKPLHGELKLPGMANDFYKKQIAQHIQIGIEAMEILQKQGSAKLHSRKLRSFKEVGFK